MQAWFLIEFVTLALSIPVLALSYYWCILLGTSLKYPRNLAKRRVHLLRYPQVSILMASFNERYVVERSLEAMKHLDYPPDKVRIVLADDSTDETVQIIDHKVRELNSIGLDAVVSRRPNRDHFKCGALNKAMDFVVGEYILLLDADSIVPPDVLTKGIDALESHENAGFISYRYGHYNRDYNMVTKLFALAQDMGDVTSKMGAYLVDSPFSFQGGFTLVRAKDLKDVGQWSNERIADDTEVSIKLYLKGKRGIYLSNVSIMSEDPSTLEAWKKQSARISQGWWRCVAKYWKQIIFAKNISLRKRASLFLMITAPFSSLSWIIVTFLSAFAIATNIIEPPNSIFANPIYIAVLTIPYAVSLLAGVWALRVQNILTVKNLILIPVLSYAEGAMITLSALGLFYGVFNRQGFFLYRTPKSGTSAETTRTHYFQSLANDRNAIIEGILAVAGIVLGIFVLTHGMWFLSLSMAGFGLCTLKSMNLTRIMGAKKEPQVREIAPPMIAQKIANAQFVGGKSNVSGIFVLSPLRKLN